MLCPTEGEVLIDGARVRGMSPKWNMMFQEASLYPWMTVFENASLGLRFNGKKKKSKEIVLPLLELVGQPTPKVAKQFLLISSFYR